MLVPIIDQAIVAENIKTLARLQNDFSSEKFIRALFKEAGCEITSSDELVITPINYGDVNLCVGVDASGKRFFVKNFLPFVRNNPAIAVVPHGVELARKEERLIDLFTKISSATCVSVAKFCGVSERHNAVISEWADGAPLSYSKPDTVSLASYYDIGFFMESLHSAKVTESNSFPVRSSGTIETFVGNAISEGMLSTRFSPFVDEWISDYRKARKVLTHGDFSPKNLMVGNGAVTVIDFQDVMFDDPSRDLGQFAGDLANWYLLANKDISDLSPVLEMWMTGYKNDKTVSGDKTLWKRTFLFAGMTLLYRSLKLYSTTSRRGKANAENYALWAERYMTDAPSLG